MHRPILLAGAVCAVLGVSPAVAQSFDDVFQAEIAFDAFTHDHGYTKGFFTYSAPDAIAFDGSGPIRIHDKLAVSLAKDASEKDAPSKLRWRPYRIAAAATGDMAYDLGPWTMEGASTSGWFLTVWKKQPDGQWRWVLDTGAGPAVAGQTPPAGAYEISRIDGSAPDANAAAEVDRLDAALNTSLKTRPAAGMYTPRDLDYLIVASDGAPPARNMNAALTALATRPQGLVWTQDGKDVAADNRFAYTYGHASAPDGSYRGHYVRVWVRMGLKPTDWTQSVDLYQAGK